MQPGFGDGQRSLEAPRRNLAQGYGLCLAGRKRHLHRFGAVGHGAALDDEVVALLPAVEGLLLEVGLLHQPMREAAQQFGLRAATLEATRPQPALVGQQLRHAAFVLAREHQQRLVAGTRHHRLARLRRGVDEAEPAAPAWRLASGIGKVLGDRVLPALVGEHRLERLLHHVAGGNCRHDVGERRAVEAILGGEIRA